MGAGFAPQAKRNDDKSREVYGEEGANEPVESW